MWKIIIDKLNFEFENRVERNPSYSLRAYARDLKLTPSHLSGLLKGRTGLSPERANQVAAILNFEPKDLKLFTLACAALSSRSSKVRKRAELSLNSRLQRSLKWKRFSETQFELVAQWYHLPLVEICGLQKNGQTLKALSDSIGLPLLTVQKGLKCLIKVGAVNCDTVKIDWEKSRFRRELEFTLFDSSTPSQTIRNFHTGIMHKAIASIDSVPMEQREFRSLIFSAHHTQLPKIRAAIQDLTDLCATESQENAPADTVYSLGIQLVPLNIKQEL